MEKYSENNCQGHLICIFNVLFYVITIGVSSTDYAGVVYHMKELNWLAN